MVAYLNFDELLYSEYWLQRRINSYSCIEPFQDMQGGTTQLKYKFLNDDEIDIEVILNDAGFVFLSTGNWYANTAATKNFNFQTNPEKTRKLIQEFHSLYTATEHHSTEDHLSALYYTLEFTNITTKEELTIDYFNYVPDDDFLELTSEIVEVGNEVLGEL